VKLFERWWWPAFIPVYALWVFPIPGLLDGGSPSKIAVATLWLIVGLIINWVAYPTLRLSDVVHLPRALLKHPPVLVALLFGIWTLLSSSFSNYPGISYSGTLNGLSDGAVWNCALCLVFVCVYIHTTRDPDLKRRMALSLLASASLMVVLGIVEIVTGRGLLYIVASAASLPIVGFYGRGHLMGILALAAGTGLALWFSGSKWVLIPVSALAALIGYSFHRAPWLAILPVIPLGWWVTKRLSMTLVAGLVVASSIAFGIFAGTQARTGVARDLSSENTLSTRGLLWKAAAGGIADRPLTGWGGGQFQYEFYRFWSMPERRTFFKLEFGTTYQGIMGEGKINPIFIYTDTKGNRKYTLISLWKAHNQLLDVGVMWGLPGLILYILLVLYSLRGTFKLEPLAVGLLIYQFYLITWYVIQDSEGIFFALMGAAAVFIKQAQAAKSTT
jgi:O-antigen ligase